MYTHIKTILFSLMMFSLMAGSYQALAVSIDTISGLPANTVISIPDLDVHNEKTDKHGELDVKLDCTEGETYRINDENGNSLTPFVCHPISTLSYSAIAVGTVAAVVGIVANSSGGGSGTAATPGDPVDPGAFSSCIVRIPANVDLTASSGPTVFSTSPVILFGNPGHSFFITLTVGTGFGGGVSISASGGTPPGSCNDTCNAAGTTFPLTLNCGGGCGFASMEVLSCVPGAP